MWNWKVNRKLLPMKAHYFLFNAGTAPVVPFMSIYAKQLGFSSVTVGVIYTILPFSGMIAKPLLGAIADRYKIQRGIFLAGQLVAAVMFLAMIFLPGVPTRATMDFVCNLDRVELDACTQTADKCTASRLKSDTDGEIVCHVKCPSTDSHRDTVCRNWGVAKYCRSNATSTLDFTTSIQSAELTGDCLMFKVGNVTVDGRVYYPSCSSPILAKCEVRCESYALNEFLTVGDDTDVYRLTAFWLMLGVFLVSWLGQAVTVSVSDTICFQILENRPIRYGFQRMFGALGWGIFSIASGLLLDAFSKGRVDKNYAPVFSLGIAMLILSVVVSTRIQYAQQRLISPNIIKDVGNLFCNVRIVVFVLWCVSVGLCTGLMWNFLFWHLEDLAAKHDCALQNRIKTIEGLIMGIQTLAGELPFFFLSNWILKWLGHVHAMTLVLLVIGGRFVFYSLITNPWHCLPLEPLNGVTFGLFYATMASYASMVAPPGVETTTQGLVGAMFEGIGVSAGSFIGGVLFQECGGSRMFRMYGMAALAAGVLHAFVQYLLGKRNCSKSKETNASESSVLNAYLTRPAVSAAQECYTVNRL